MTNTWEYDTFVVGTNRQKFKRIRHMLKRLKYNPEDTVIVIYNNTDNTQRVIECMKRSPGGNHTFESQVAESTRYFGGESIVGTGCTKFKPTHVMTHTGRYEYGEWLILFKVLGDVY